MGRIFKEGIMLRYIKKDRFNKIDCRENKKIVASISFKEEKECIKVLSCFYDKDNAFIKILNYLEVLANKDIIIEKRYLLPNSIIEDIIDEGDYYRIPLLKLDCHIHVGAVPSSNKSNSHTLYFSPLSCSQFIKSNSITNAIILYSKYEELEEVKKDLDESGYKCEIVGLKWIDHYSFKNKNDYYNELKDDINKPLFKGIKLHDVRTFNKNHKKERYSLKILSPLLDLLPNNSIILSHLQNSYLNDPSTLLDCAIHYPNLQFILGHCGINGIQSTRPHIKTVDEYIEKSKRTKSFTLRSYICAQINLKESITLSYLPNVYLDSSNFILSKETIFNNTNKACFGSDFNFFKLSYVEECLRYIPKLENKHFYKINKDALEFFKKDYKNKLNDFIINQ